MITSLAGIVVCALIIFASARIGLSRLLGRYAVLTKSIPAASEAVRLTPSDADAHRALAATFQHVQMYQEAQRELEIATSLRPGDDYLWLELGTTRDQLDNAVGALVAFDQSVAHAPYYAHTRWQRANVRLRLGRYDEAFAELREAATSNRMYLPTLIDLAWSMSRGEMKATEQLAGINSVQTRIAFARFLAAKGRGKETVEQFRQVAPFVTQEQRRELVRRLMAAHVYYDAYSIWKGEASISNTSEIYDGGFEGSIGFGDAGFGWNVSREPAVEVSLDTSEKDSGTKAMRVDYRGESPPGAPILSQMIIVRPEQKYRINFAARTKDIVTGGLPFLSVTDGRTDVVLTKSPNFSQDSTSWQKQSIEFTTPSSCESIALRLERSPCQSMPCPIFGVLWLDSFSIEEIKQ